MARPAVTRTPARTGYHFAKGSGSVTGEITAVTADAIVRDLEICKGATVDFTVNSPGGELDAGVRIARAIREHGGVRAHLKKADSAALAFTAAATVTVEDGASYLFHRPAIVTTETGVSVSVEGLRDVADATDKHFSDFAYAIGRVSGGMVQLLAGEDRRLSAQEMLVYRFADRVAPRPVTADPPDADANLETEIAAGVAAAIAQLRQQLIGR